MRFKEFMINEGGRRTSGKTILYPLSYGGIGLYPDADFMTHSADAILYLTKDTRLWHNGDEKPFCITHLPGHKQYGDLINNGEKKPFSIEHIPEKQKAPKYKLPPGKISSFKSFIKLVQDPREITPKCKEFPEN